MTELEEQIKVVAVARKDTKRAKDTVSAARITWEEENEEIIKYAEIRAAELGIDEATLRDLTLVAYAATGNKAPAKGVGIREVTKLTYDPQVAYDWAVSHQMALKLDVTAFEKITKASPVSFVEVSTEPLATIAKDLEENND